MTKEELSQCMDEQAEIKQIAEMINQLRANARSAKAVCYDGEFGTKGDKLPDVQKYIERLEELSSTYEDKVKESSRHLIAVDRAISKLPTKLRVLIRYRYIMGYSWEKTAEKMYISIGTFHNWHKLALKLLESEN